MERLNFWQRYFTYAIAVILVLVGIILKLVKFWLPSSILDIVDGLAIAFFTTAIIGFTVDMLFRKQLARDVFEATIGYLLPKELRPHMRWIYEHSLICTCDTISLELTEISNNYLRLHVTRIQTLENKGNKTVTNKPALSIDEWHIPDHMSRIINFTCKTDKES